MTPAGAALRAEAANWVNPFVVAFCSALDEAGVRWLVLRNHEHLDRVGHDVDMVVHPDDVGRLATVVEGVVRERDLFLLRIRRGIEHHSFDVAQPQLHGRLLLHIDVQTAVAYRGRTLIDVEDLFAHRTRSGNVWTLTPGMEAYALLLHAALHKGALKESYASRVAAIEDESPGALLQIATRRLGAELGRRLAGVRTEPELLALRPRLAAGIDRRYPGNRWRRPWFTVQSGVSMTNLRLRPRGVFIVFLGPDGSGKSTTTDLLAKMLTDPSGVLPVHRVYLGSGSPLLPTRKMRRRLNAGRQAAQAQLAVRDVRPRRLRGAVHVMADEIARYWVHVRPRLSPHGIVLADRYAYDVLRINNRHVESHWFRRIATAVIPSPDITFFLEGDPAVIVARKKELTLAETVRQQAAYRELASFVPTFRALDLTVRDDAALRGVARQILDAFAARNGGVPGGARGRPMTDDQAHIGRSSANRRPLGR
jgi:thymidylate kinase